jgi:TPR repeat protein
MEDEMNTGNASKIPSFYKALMVAIAVVTLLAVWLVPDNSQPTPPPLPELPGTQKSDAGLSQPADGSAAVILDGDRAKDFVASLRSDSKGSDPDTVFVEAERLQGEGYIVDAHLLYRFAARHGHGQAALVLGTQADPAFYAATSPDTLQDSPEQAYKWYSMAAAAGIEEAVTRLQALHQNVEMSASAGDERAQRLLLLWQ